MPKTGSSNDRGRDDVQGLRGIAVLVVVLYHAGLPLSGGFVGVDVFFVVSGFVITAMLARELRATGRLRIGRFFARRVRRLLPALAVVLTVTAALSAIFASPFGAQQTTAKTGLAASAFLANIGLLELHGGYFDTAAESNPLLHVWSLAVEEQFYLVYPLLVLGCFLFAARRKQSATTVTAAVLVVLGLASLAACLLVARLPGGEPLAFYLAPTRAWEFAAGALVALAVPLAGRIGQRVARLGSYLGAAALGTAVVWIGPHVPYPGTATLLPVLATALLIWCGTARRDALPVLVSRPMTALGDLSYSWYLWHWPAVVFTGLLLPSSDWALVLAAAASLLPAWVSYRCVEAPIRRATTLGGSKTLRLGLACVLVPAAAMAMLGAGAQRGWGSDRLEEVADQIGEPPSGSAAGCHIGMEHPALGDWSSEPCHRPPVGSAATSLPTYLVGDSNAAMLSEAVLASDSKRPVTLRTRAACPFVQVLTTRDRQQQRACQDFTRETLAWLQGQPPGVVVLAIASSRYLDDSRYRGRPMLDFVDPDTGGVRTSSEAKAGLLQAGLTASILGLRDAGHAVLLVHVIPHYPDWDPRTCSTFTILSRNCVRQVPWHAVRTSQADAHDVERTAAERGGAEVLDLGPEVCGPQVCSTRSGGTWTYRDGTHLTVAAARGLADEFAIALQRLESLGNREESV